MAKERPKRNSISGIMSRKHLKKGAGAISEKHRQIVIDKISKLRTEQRRVFILDILDSKDPEDAFDATYDTKPEFRIDTINRIMRSSDVKEIIQFTNQVTISNRQRIAAHAAELTMDDVMLNSKSKARVMATMYVLDRTQGRPAQTLNVQTINWHRNFGKSFLRDKMRGYHRKNLELRVEAPGHSRFLSGLSMNRMRNNKPDSLGIRLNAL